MKISIITVNYNNGDLLQLTIDSVLRQTYADYEYHIIDGGSKDASKSIIEKYASQLTSWVSETDNGIYDAMNKGIVRANGEFCLFLNSGDTFFSEHVLANVADQLVYDFNCGDASLIYKEGTSLWQAPEKIDELFFLQRFSICHQSVFIRTELLKYRMYSTEYTIVSDYEQIFYEMVVNKKTYGRIPEVISNYSMDGVSSNHERADLEKQRVIAYFRWKKWIEMDPLISQVSSLKIGTKKYRIVKDVVRLLLSCLPK